MKEVSRRMLLLWELDKEWLDTIARQNALSDHGRNEFTVKDDGKGTTTLLREG